jgi:hypothetical protein
VAKNTGLTRRRRTVAGPKTKKKVKIRSPEPRPGAFSYFLGIDPGASGALSCLTADGRLLCTPMPEGDDWEEAVWRWVSDFMDAGAFACVERVGGYIRSMPSPDGSKERRGGPQPGSAAFKFGRSYGCLRMALVAADVPFYDPAPHRWQPALGIAPKSKSETKTAFKSRLRDLAVELLPGAKITIRAADSALLAVYCRRLMEGSL